MRLSTALALALLLGAPLSAQNKPTLTATDYDKWESVGQTRLSPDGHWVASAITRVGGENEIRLRGGPRDTTIVIAMGSGAAFSANSTWMGALVQVKPQERERLTAQRRPAHNSFVAYNLTSAAKFELADVQAFSFSPDGRFLLLTRYPAEGKRVSDLLIHDLSSGARYQLNSVPEHAWADAGALLAFIVTADGGAGNSVQLFDGDARLTRVLEASQSQYRGLAWRLGSTDLAVLRSITDKAFLDTANAVIAWPAADKPSATPQIFDPVASPAGLDRTLRIGEGRRPVWSADGKTLFIGVQERRDTSAAIKKSSSKVSDVEIWHTGDVRVIPQQRSSESSDLRATRLAAWKPGSNSVLPLASDASETQRILPGDAYITESDRKPYSFGQKFGRPDQDIWVVSVNDGTRRKLLEAVRHYIGPDPTGNKLVWFDGRDYWSVDVATGARTNLTASLTSKKRADFVNRDDDHPVDVLPPIRGAMWTNDGSRFVAYAGTDIWSIAADGGTTERLTQGEAEGIEYRIVNLGGGGGGSQIQSVDFASPMYLSMRGRRTKMSGYARLANNRVEKLQYADAQIAGLAKADSADRYVFTRQSFTQSPNVYAAGADLANPTALTNTNPFQSDYAWGKAELMDFNSTIGKKLQAILYYPANYDPSKKYPMIVYTYELLTQGLHRYIVPRENDYYNANVFTQNGYFVLMPDIVFRPREPGLAVLQSVEPAVKKVISRGLVDAARVGHVGHSQGGYEAAYLATYSKLFATTIMGSGISDLYSFAGQMHWSSMPEFDHWETGQFRMQVPPWEDWEAMRRNNPILRVHDMQAKSILIEIGSEDPTVDMRQGVEMYNYARRAGKDAVMLLYPGEGHSLSKRENAVDYERRILQWFAHYLKGEPAASWITDGQSWIERKRILDANK